MNGNSSNQEYRTATGMPSSASGRPPRRLRLMLIVLALLPVGVTTNLVLVSQSPASPLSRQMPRSTSSASISPRTDTVRTGRFMQRLRPADVQTGTGTSTISPIPEALAQIYARRGAQEDGCRQTLPGLDATQESWLPQAEALLAMDHAILSTHRPTLVADGRMSVAEAPSATAPASPSAALAANPGTQGEAPPAPSSVQHDLRATHTQIPRAIIGDTLDQTVIADDTWAAIPFRPDQVGFEPLTLHDTTSTGHALCLYANDFASIRVNGGLAVPGRFYLIGAHLTITSSIPVQVLIRPLSALASYYPSSAHLPSADG